MTKKKKPSAQRAKLVQDYLKKFRAKSDEQAPPSR